MTTDNPYAKFSPALAAQAAFVICSPMTDAEYAALSPQKRKYGVHTLCADCHTPIAHHIAAPREPLKVCHDCGATRAKAAVHPVLIIMP